MDSSAKYGPPPPPPLVGGNVPSRRIQTQLPPEAPACVQNAMMTKDKKPFTYTPGGIDLSQIRSPRMAQRISRNACMEGVTNTPKPSINAQYNNEPQIKTTPPTPPIAACALGMPVQVFPTGPPPPPPPPKHQLAPQPPTQNGSGKSSPERRSPSQSFEPPPIGFRPEIKIPPNPMASLKKAPKPQPKDEFWKEEYIRDRSKSPMNTSPQNGVNEEVKPQSPPVNRSNETKIQQQQQQNDREETEPNPQVYMNRVTSPPNSTSSPTAAILPRPLSPIRLQDNAQNQQQVEQQRQEQIRREQERQEQIRQRQEQILREQQKQREELVKQEQQRQEQLRRQQEQPRQEFQSQEEYEQDYQKRLAAHRREQARLAELERQEAAKLQQQELQRRENLQKQEQQRQEQMKLQDRRLQQQQQQQQPPAPPINEQQRLQFLNQRWGVPVKEKSPETEPRTQSPPPKNNALGSLYIPPVAPENLSPILLQQQHQSVQSPQQQQWQNRPRDDQEQLINQTTPIWMAPKQQIVQPEWAARDEANRANMNGPREHIIPIQLEHTPTKTPSTPGFGPQPFYNAHQQYSSVPPPMPSYMTQGGYQQPNPNQFVNQYTNVSFPPPRVTSPPVNQSPTYQNGGGRVVAPVIQYENGNGYRGPISQSPTIIQNDPRSLQHQNSWGPNNSGPNQSKSFRILQKITDTLTDNNDTDSEVDSGPGELQKPHYARPLGPQDMNEAQLRKLQLNDRVKSQDQPQQPYIHPSEQQVPEPKKYMGSAIPSRSFRILQAMTTPENAGPGQSDL